MKANLLKLILSLSAICFIMPLSAQETCRVMVPAIAAKYEGPCKKGKADGEGKADGTDHYAGTFKDGFPSGQGLYRWENGDFYEGKWYRGKMDGQGIKTFKRAGKADSVVSGFWKRDIYVGKFESPYIIHSQTNQIARIEIQKKSEDDENSITIELSNTSGGIPSLGVSPGGAKASITNINIMAGAYLRSVNMMDGPKGTSQKLTEVEFPFKARFKIGTQEMVIEILEPGTWLISAFLNN